MSIWFWWVVAALVFIILEIFTSGFAVACFSVGCLAAAVSAAIAPHTFWLQVLLFAVFSVLAIIFVRPLVLKYMDKGEKPSNADTIVGQIAKVVEAIPAGDKGRVRVFGDDWQAVGEGGAAIPEGTKVTIVARDGNIVTVKTL